MSLVDNGDGTFGFDVSDRMYALSRMRLLDAAPDLLAALKELLAWAKDVHDPRIDTNINYAAMDAADAAIKKATGEIK